MSQISFPETAKQEQLNPITQDSIQNPHYQEYLKLSQKQWTFADLLPMKLEKTIVRNNEQKIKLLHLLYHCYRTASEALQAFYIDKNPELFDAHMGECACQIRAIKLAVMLKEMQAEDCEDAHSLMQLYTKHSHKILDLINQYTVAPQIKDHVFVCDFLKEYDLNFTLTKDEIFLVVSFILSSFKKRITIDMFLINLDTLSNTWHISKGSTDNFINHIQKIGSLLSVDFVLSYEFHDPSSNKLFLTQLQRDHLGRWMLPCLETIGFMLDLMKKYTILSLVQVFIEECDGFKPSFEYLCKNNFFYIYENSIKPNKFKEPIIRIEAFVKNKLITQSAATLCKYLNRYELVDIVKFNAAIHPAYRSESLAHFNDNPYKHLSSYFPSDYLEAKFKDLQDRRACAMKDGFCKTNPQTLAIVHIAASAL